MSNPDMTRVTRAPISIDNCGMAKASALLGDKWTLLILREAFYGVLRFADMQADIAIPKAALSNRLAKLVAAGVLTKQPYQDPNARTRYEYHLSAAGRDVSTVLIALMNWGDTHLADGQPSIALIDKSTGQGVRAGLLDDNGNPVVPAQISAQIPKPS